MRAHEFIKESDDNVTLKVVNTYELDPQDTGLDDVVTVTQFAVLKNGEHVGDAEYDSYFGDFKIDGDEIHPSDPLYKQAQQLVGESTDDYTDHDDPQKLKDMYLYYVNVKGMDPEKAKRLVYDRDRE